MGLTETALDPNRPITDPDSRLLERLRETASRRDLDVSACLEQASGWVRDWWDSAIAALDEPPPVRELVSDNAAHYAVWHAVGPTKGDQPGFLALHRFAIREARSVDRGTEAANETWLDVRTRLEKTVERAAAGKSVPDFTGPKPFGEDNTHRYHGIQVRLRVAGKWTRHKATEIYEEGRHSSEWKGAFRAAEARTYALPLHFAAWWTLLDVKTRRTRDGRVKGPSWWWSMLLHALDLRKVDALGGDRNDPTEALLRIRLRFAVAQGLAGWLRRWSTTHPYWSQVEFGLPDPDNERARRAATEALDAIRPALHEAIDALDITPAERKALTGTLIRGENVRTSTKAMSGADASERQARLFSLGERAGRDAADRLGGGSGGSAGGGGGTGRHEHVDVLMAKVASGRAPSMEEVSVLSAAVAECEHCRQRWAGIVDFDPYVDAATAEIPRTGRRWAAGLGTVALAAAALFFVPSLVPDAPEIGLRGAEGTVPAHMDLFLVSRSGVERFAGEATIGDRLVFQISADQTAQVGVWVDGPEGPAELGWQAAGIEAVTLGESASGDATTYAFEKSGRYVFTASTQPVGPDGACEAPTCVRTVVEVSP